MAQVTEQSERANQLSEQDVINVLELVLAEYPIDRDAMFLAGHSMGSGGLLRDWLTQQGFMSEYLEVNSDHGGMIPLVLPAVFEFFGRAR